MKPSFVVKTSGNSKENVARLISDSLQSGNTPLPLLREYLYHASESFSAKNGKEAWTSYGVIIVPAGKTYNPLDIADFDAEEEGADIRSSNRTPYEDKVLGTCVVFSCQPDEQLPHRCMESHPSCRHVVPGAHLHYSKKSP